MSEDIPIPHDAGHMLRQFASSLEDMAARLHHTAGLIDAGDEDYQTSQDYRDELDRLEQELEALIDSEKGKPGMHPARIDVIRNHLDAYERRQKEKQEEENHG